ncbi:MAG TPA: hypothetical protein VFR87_02300 [Nocardioidaceae bacterium]|nr:hypothetical protein [Nocardioidaceae bacterium]
MESWLIAIGLLGTLLLLMWLTRGGRRAERRLTDAERQAIGDTPGHRMRNGWGGGV